MAAFKFFHDALILFKSSFNMPTSKYCRIKGGDSRGGHWGKNCISYSITFLKRLLLTKVLALLLSSLMSFTPVIRG